LQEQRARILISLLFVASLLVQCGLLLAAQLHGGFDIKELPGLLTIMFGLYAPHLGLTLGATFSGTNDSSFSMRKSLFWTAVALALAWNVLLIVRTVVFTSAAFTDLNDSQADLIAYMEKIGAPSSVLVVAPLAYFFTKRSA
jgi:hypothetical protein